MINPNLFLMEHTLKSSFNLIVILVNNYKEEREVSFKKKRKDFIRENNSRILRVILIEDYPPKEMELNVYYIKNNGKTIWLKMKERDFEGMDLSDL